MKNIVRKIFIIIIGGLISFSIPSCDNTKTTKENVSQFVSIKGQNFIDPQGRDLILHGINVINKDPKTNYLGHVGPEDFEKFNTWGFNVIRLGIIWDGLEPEPGVYNEEYLKGIDQMIQWASDNNIYVFLDMHQDLYSVEFSDGAPSWATLDNDQPHQTGEIWSDSYLISPAVQQSFDNFWNNTPVSDGIGVQDHYINLWKHLANRYADNTTIIGFDIMNEPFMGSGANNVMPLLLESYAKILVKKTGQAPPSAEELMYMWSAERLKVLEILSEKETYRKMIDGIYEVNAEFEKGPLTAFFQKSRDAIREVNKNHIIFTEHSYFTNMGVTGALGE
ncbi:MAG: cellulase family glycosylhydrolase, partial [Cyclobacteriaceae bacterium]|nr:cellulase family glycosylhydrolase [Cyclobacteriaceae bacterium]